MADVINILVAVQVKEHALLFKEATKLLPKKLFSTDSEAV
jgi:hypothetical protein